MKRFFCLVLVLPILLLSSCDLLKANGESIKKIETLIENIQNKNNEGIQNLFADNIRNKISNFDVEVNRLIDYFEGNYEGIISMTSGGRKEQDGFKVIKFLDYNNWEIKTTEHYYYFSIYWCVIDDFDSNNIGIWNLCVQVYNPGELPIPIDGKEWENGDEYIEITLR